MKKSVCLIAVLTVLGACLQYQVFMYQAVLPMLLLPNNTAYINLSDKSRDWRNCKWFDMCHRYARASHLPIVRRTEVAFRG
jgi:hypothetical protein